MATPLTPHTPAKHPKRGIPTTSSPATYDVQQKSKLVVCLEKLEETICVLSCNDELSLKLQDVANDLRSRLNIIPSENPIQATHYPPPIQMPISPTDIFTTPSPSSSLGKTRQMTIRDVTSIPISFTKGTASRNPRTSHDNTTSIATEAPLKRMMKRPSTPPHQIVDDSIIISEMIPAAPRKKKGKRSYDDDLESTPTKRHRQL